MRLALIRVIDPIEYYMLKHDSEQMNARLGRSRRGQRPVRWTAYGPGLTVTPSGVAAPPLRADRTPEEVQRRLEAHTRRAEVLQREHAAPLEKKAKELLAGREAIIETTAGNVRARLTRFRTGAVIENWHTSPQRSEGHGMMRLDRRLLADPVPVIVHYLVEAVLELGPDARPLG